jgi:predicted adenylyl cyclase CyaB
MRRVNVEIKARTVEPERIRSILENAGARCVGTDLQTDTYFSTGKGRLKLREGNIETALIWYERPDGKAPKTSKVLLYHPANARDLKDILVRLFDVDVVVEKQRDIFFLGNVKFHVDDVRGLGQYVEIEAIDDDGTRTPDVLRAQCVQYMGILGIGKENLESVSYSDLMRSARGSRKR